jgi:hypothetical protein
MFATIEIIFCATRKMVPALQNIFSFDKKMVSGIKKIFCMMQTIFMTTEIIAAPQPIKVGTR